MSQSLPNDGEVVFRLGAETVPMRDVPTDILRRHFLESARMLLSEEGIHVRAAVSLELAQRDRR
jgi:hypothetical protein